MSKRFDPSEESFYVRDARRGARRAAAAKHRGHRTEGQEGLRPRRGRPHRLGGRLRPWELETDED